MTVKKICNINYNKKVTFEVNEITSILDKTLGLLKKNSYSHLLFKTRFGIHTFGLNRPIEVIILDKNFNVVKLGTVKSNKLFFYNPKYFWVLEMPLGTLKKYQIKLGDKLQFS